MKNDLHFRKRIGISSRAVRKMPLEKSIEAAYKAEFRVFEIVPHLHGRPESLSQRERRKLKEKLSCFNMVTMHCSGARTTDDRRMNVASSEPLHRHNSIELLLELTQLSLDIGAKVVTFHAAAGDEKTTPVQVREAMVMFARMALDKVKDSDLIMGYEIFDRELVKEIGDPRFGILFDIPHAGMRFEGDLTAGILHLIEESYPFIVQFHAHGMQVMEDGEKHDHRPFQVNNGIDYTKILSVIKGYGLSCPIVFEIGTEGSPQEVEDSIFARDELIRIWQEF